MRSFQRQYDNYPSGQLFMKPLSLHSFSQIRSSALESLILLGKRVHHDVKRNYFCERISIHVFGLNRTIILQRVFLFFRIDQSFTGFRDDSRHLFSPSGLPCLCLRILKHSAIVTAANTTPQRSCFRSRYDVFQAGRTLEAYFKFHRHQQWQLKKWNPNARRGQLVMTMQEHGDRFNERNCCKRSFFEKVWLEALSYSLKLGIHLSDCDIYSSPV